MSGLNDLKPGVIPFPGGDISIRDWYGDATLFTSGRVPSQYHRPKRKLSAAETVTLESAVQKHAVSYAKKMRLGAYKYSSPSNRSVPDYLFILPGGRTFFIEFKRPGETLTLPQASKHAEMHALGSHVYTCDCKVQSRLIILLELSASIQSKEVIHYG